MDSMTDVIIIGFAQSTLTKDLVNLISKTRPTSVLDPDKLLAGHIPDHCEFLISVTRDLSLRKMLCNFLDQHQLPRATYVHHTAMVDSAAQIGKGCFIAPFASVFNAATIGSDCIIGPYSMVSHDASVGTGTIFHPGAMIAGSSKIGKHCLMGMRSTVIDKLEICDSVSIGAGSMVTKNISVPGHWVGSPARKVA